MLIAGEAKRASFTPIIASCEAIFDKEADVYFKTMAKTFSKKWKSSYSQAINYIKARAQVCILRSMSICFRGLRNPRRGVGFVDAASLPANVQDIE